MKTVVIKPKSEHDISANIRMRQLCELELTAKKINRSVHKIL